MDNELQDITSDEKKNIYLEYALFLILGILLGIVVKTEAGKRITIGYEDYQLNTKKSVYNINQLEKDIADKAKKEQAAQQGNQPAASGPAQTENTTGGSNQ